MINLDPAIYTMRYSHSNHALGVIAALDLDATTDDEAISEVIACVRAGYRNVTWGRVRLSNGRDYVCRNVNGIAQGGCA